MKELAFEDCRADPSRDGGFLCLQQVVRKKSILLANIHCILAFRVMGDRSRGLLRFGPREKAISMTDTQNKATAFVFLDKIKQEAPRNTFPLRYCLCVSNPSFERHFSRLGGSVVLEFEIPYVTVTCNGNNQVLGGGNAQEKVAAIEGHGLDPAKSSGMCGRISNVNFGFEVFHAATHPFQRTATEQG